MIQAGLLTPLTFSRHRLSPLAVSTSGSYFLHNGRRWQWIGKVYAASFNGILFSFLSFFFDVESDTRHSRLCHIILSFWLSTPVKSRCGLSVLQKCGDPGEQPVRRHFFLTSLHYYLGIKAAFGVYKRPARAAKPLSWQSWSHRVGSRRATEFAVI